MKGCKGKQQAREDRRLLKPAAQTERVVVVIGRGTCGNRAMASVMTRGLFLDRAISVARVLRPDRAVLVVTTGTRPGLSSRDRFIVGDASLRDGGLESPEPGLRSDRKSTRLNDRH